MANATLLLAFSKCLQSLLIYCDHANHLLVVIDESHRNWKPADKHFKHRYKFVWFLYTQVEFKLLDCIAYYSCVVKLNAACVACASYPAAYCQVLTRPT